MHKDYIKGYSFLISSTQVMSKIKFSEKLLYFHKIGCIILNEINTGELVKQAERK
jgi:hypothetical protein